MNKNFYIRALFTLAIFLIAISLFNSFYPTSNSKKPNILLIIVDDLRPELKCYGKNHMKTPNIDKLASEGILFTMAYCQVASCLPSRQSFLTGLRPNEDFLIEYFRTKMPNLVTLPQYFKDHAYLTESIGKVFHIQDSISWTSAAYYPKPFLFFPEYRTVKNVEFQIESFKKGSFSKEQDLWWTDSERWYAGSSWEAPNLPEQQLYDGRITVAAIERLQYLKDKTFFLAVGLHRPHLPFVAPKNFYDLYPISEIKLSKNKNLPKGAPTLSIDRGLGEIEIYTDISKNLYSNETKQKELLRGYFACVSYVDSLVGHLLKALEANNLEKNTIVILLGDHGYHLFEQGTFGKHTCFENSSRVPLIIRYPKLIKKDIKTDSLVELVDLFPTLIDLASLPHKNNIDGESFIRVLKNPDLEHKEAALTVIAMPGVGYKVISARTNRFRYTEWIHRKNKTVIKELYDYTNEPDESINLANDPKYKKEIARLSAILRSKVKKMQSL